MVCWWSVLLLAAFTHVYSLVQAFTTFEDTDANSLVQLRIGLSKTWEGETKKNNDTNSSSANQIVLAKMGPLRAMHGLTSTTKMLEFHNTLEHEVKRHAALIVQFTNHPGCQSHFYHVIMNGAFPIFAKMVWPFTQQGARPPRRQLYVHDMGGSIRLLTQAIPDFNFSFVPWVCSCCSTHCKGCPQRNLSIPAVRIDNQHFEGRHGYAGVPFPKAKAHRQLLLHYREYTLTFIPHAAEHQSGPDLVFISRNEAPVNSKNINLGSSSTGPQRRSIKNEAQLISAIARAFQSMPHAGLFSASSKFRVLHLENKAFQDQVAYFRSARMLVAQHGAGMLHCLWMPQGSVVVEIVIRKDPTFFQWLCQSVRGLKYRRFVAGAGYQVHVGLFF